MVKKDYERFYERVFSFDKADPSYVKLADSVTFAGFEKNQDFLDAYAEVHRALQLAFWDAAVRIAWFQSKIRFKGKKRASANIVRLVENTTTSNPRLRGIDPYIKGFMDYFAELFPDFQKKNPLKHPEYYKFPFKFISPIYLNVVSKMDAERMFLLKNAEERKMNYATFLDYVANFVLCCNQELGQDVFELMQLDDGTFRVIDVTKKKRK